MIGFLMTLLAAGTQPAIPLADQATTPRRTGFMCSFFYGPAERPGGRLTAVKERSLGFLLADDWSAVEAGAPIEEFDPHRLLEGRRLARFVVADRKKPIFAVTTEGSESGSEMFLGLEPDKGRVFKAALGKFESGSRSFGHYGGCVMVTEAAFQDFKAGHGAGQ
jgi:hypothetical protein